MLFHSLVQLSLMATVVLSATTANPNPTRGVNDGGSVLISRDVAVSTVSNKTLQSIILQGHNSPRGTYHATTLAWDNDLATYAQKWVNKCQFAHSGGPYGENLYAVLPAPLNSWDAATADALKAWVAESQNYDYGNPGFAANTGHFTQFVWKGTQKVGCAWNTEACKGITIFMCNYLPAGNVAGQYQSNVQRP